MSMSKKHYQAIARALYLRKPVPEDLRMPIPSAGGMWRGITNDLANVFAADNPRFDRARFLEACETGTTKGMSK